MNLHWLQHVPFEGLGRIENWVRAEEYGLSCTRLFAGEELPKQDEFQMLVVMGGPMGIHDEQHYEWLAHEKAFIKNTIKEGKPVLGICLGAQLLASVLGADVVVNGEKEIGWFPVERTKMLPDGMQGILPSQLTVFHWHGDTFGIPANAVSLYASTACKNQAFLYDGRVIGLQFHLETTPEGVDLLIENCGDELVESQWIQQVSQLRAFPAKGVTQMNTVLVNILEYLALRAKFSNEQEK